MKFKLIALGAGIALAAAVAASAPASAATAIPAKGIRCAANVCLYRPNVKSVPRDPPLTTQIHVGVSAYVSEYPQAWQDNVTLKWWRSAKALHRPRGAWVTIHPTLAWREVDLPAHGHRLRPMKYLIWDECKPGAYYVRMHIFGITHRGFPESVVNFFPWAGFVKGHPDKGDVSKPPTLHRAWHTKCQGGDGLTG